MSPSGVILYGPPASGKDTISRALSRLSPRFETFPRLKVGAGRADGYRFINQATLDGLIQAGDIAWINHRYNATYAVDISGLRTHLSQHISVLHLGQVPAAQAVKQAVSDARWLTIELWCPRDVAEKRARDRGSLDVADRLAAWDATEHLPVADLRIDTETVSPERAAEMIARQLGPGTTSAL